MFAHLKKLAAVVIVVSLSIFYYQKENTVAIFCSQSGTIQITCHNELLFAINEIPSTLDKAPSSDKKSPGSLTIVRVKRNSEYYTQILTELLVGSNPRSISVNKRGTCAFVSNGADNTVSVIRKNKHYYVDSAIAVGSEPRGTALTPSGKFLYVANYGDGTLSVIDTLNLVVVTTIDLGIRNPYAVAVTDNGDNNDLDESIYVSNFFAETIPGTPIDRREAFDDTKQGVIIKISVLNHVVTGKITLSPIDSGFTADRTAFQVKNGAEKSTYQVPENINVKRVPQKAYFNQLHTITIDINHGKMFIPSVGAQPEPPIRFKSNVQALIGVVDLKTNSEMKEQHRNLNIMIKNREPYTKPPYTEDQQERLKRTFNADTIAIAIHNNTALFLSRSGAFVLLGSLYDEIKITSHRFPVANIPTGIVIGSEGKKAYVNSTYSGQITVIDLSKRAVVATINTTTTPKNKGIRRSLLGALAFHTGMGLPSNVEEDVDIKDIDTHRYRDMASRRNWSSCASCHPEGLTDGVTWIFPTGPRQTLPLDASFAPGSGIANDATTDQRVFDWNAMRGSITDVNSNSRDVQGGHGFTADALRSIDAEEERFMVRDYQQIFDHGPRLGVANALDFMTEWIATSVRVLNRTTKVNNKNAQRGKKVFARHCASCHGGTKWTKSTRVMTDMDGWPDPALSSKNTLWPNARLQFFPNSSFLQSYNTNNNLEKNGYKLQIIEDVGTLDLTNPIEICGNFVSSPRNGHVHGVENGKTSVSLAVSFNVPSLFNIRNTAPYGHHGRAQTLLDVFVPIKDGGLGHKDFGLSLKEKEQVVEFIKTIDLEQSIFPLASD